ncbi:hypothetical protein DPMN_020234 [Dreissena polymorpha]|uniref:Uncharacterized protein n=1 Tax=Dreissena polymorpha TaxID=45954 RepID=A0A9D4NJV2_DREPO|nr:hypothetical protein DPMN_020234 [Dreissena polymorpha]
MNDAKRMNRKRKFENSERKHKSKLDEIKRRELTKYEQEEKEVREYLKDERIRWEQFCHDKYIQKQLNKTYKITHKNNPWLGKKNLDDEIFNFDEDDYDSDGNNEEDRLYLECMGIEHGDDDYDTDECDDSDECGDDDSDECDDYSDDDATDFMKLMIFLLLMIMLRIFMRMMILMILLINLKVFLIIRRLIEKLGNFWILALMKNMMILRI